MLRPIHAAVSGSLALMAPLLVHAGPPPASAAAPVAEIVEQAQRVELSFERGHASLRARWEIENRGGAAGESSRVLDLPPGAVALGLRVLAELEGRPRWHAGKLLAADEALDRYLGAVPGGGAPDPGLAAMLSWSGRDLVALDLGPVAPRARHTLELSTLMPARWERGRWVVELPPLVDEAGAARLKLVPARRGDGLWVDGRAVAEGHEMLADASLTIELAPASPAAVELELASLDTGAGRSLIHWRVAAAPRLSSLPKKARVVVVLDLSRSRSPAQLEAQRAAALAYLENLRDPALATEVAVLGFDRALHRLSEGFVAASTAIATLERAPLERRNGSEIGLALTEAARLLRAAPRRAPRRIVVLSDFATAARIRPADLEPALARSGAVLHGSVVEQAGRPSLARRDEGPWSALAAGSGGVLWVARVGSVAEAGQLEAGRAVFEEWARPLRLHEVEIGLLGVGGVELGVENCPTCSAAQLDEGEGLDALLFAPEGAAALSLDGMRWGEPVRREVRASAAAGDRWAALVFGADLGDELRPSEVSKLAVRGGAVSPETSYLAVVPGPRPEVSGWGRGSTCGCGDPGLHGYGRGHGSLGAQPWAFDPAAWLELALARRWRECGGNEAVALALELETTRDEIVDVQLGAAAPEAARACMLEASWALELPEAYRRIGHERFRFQL